MYVAVTRARRRLYLASAQSRMLHGQTRYCLPSSFLDEIPDQLLLRLNKKAAPEPVSYARRGGTYAGYGGESTQASAGGWRIGQSVEHAKFGQGVIVAVEGRGEEAKVQVNFGGGQGMKWLALAYAKLTAV